MAGAGPAGLALALQAHDHGAAVRVVDLRPAADRPSRALILHPRTLEVLRPLGITQALLARADITPRADLRLGSRLIRVTLADLALPDTAFPHLSLIRQMDVERVLAQALTDRGVEIERGTELTGVRDEPGGVQAVLRSPATAEEARFGFVVGCDGPSSTVRARAGIGWPGRTYPVEAVLADAELDGELAGDAARVVAGRRGVVFAFRLGERATWRLLATRAAGASQSPPGQLGPPVPAAEIQALLDEAGLGARIAELAWSSRVGLQRRVADTFRQGRLYLAGDAAHAYSPATGQGMNAGLQDAVNLGWKLAFAAAQPGDGPLLDSYDRERRPVARQVLAMTHIAFWAEASLGPVPSALRSRLAPLAAPLLPAVIGRPHLAAEAVRVLSQLGVGYRHSPLSVEGTPRRRGGPGAGDRLPDQLVTSAGRTVRLHELLARPGVHILLDRDADPLGALPPSRFITIHRLTSSPGRGLIAVRPDGYIGFRDQTAESGQLASWLAMLRVGVAQGPASGDLSTYPPRWRLPSVTVRRDAMAADVSQRAGAGLSGPGAPDGARKGWTAGRIVALVAGSILILLSAVLMAGAGFLTWADQEQHGGYLTTGTATYSTGGYALASDPVHLHAPWGWLERFAGDVRIRVTATSPGTHVFVAIGPAHDVSRYLTEVSYASVTALGDHDLTQHLGSTVPAPPSTALDWVAQVSGTGTQTLHWTVRSGDWMVLVMNLGGSPGVTVRADAGVSSPVLPALAGELLAAGIMAGLTGAALVLIPIRLASSGR